MYKGARVAAVVPAYREELMIGQVIETMPDYVDHIVIVDDCSPDDTSGAVQRLANPRVELIRHEVNLGVGGAIATGHKAALELGSDINVIMAGDAQMDPAYLPALLDRVTDDGYGFAKANRFYSPESFSGMPRHRVFGNILLSFMTKLASGYWNLFDPQNGYTAIRTDVVRRLPLDRVAKRYSFENDLLMHLNILQVPAVDVPIPAVYGDEVSSIKLRNVIPELLNRLTVGFWTRIWYRYVLWSFSPIALLLFLGLGLFAFGIAVSIWLVFQILASVIATAATVMLAALPLMIGSQMLISALQLDIQATPSTPTFPPFED
ncbi:glycosyltransferase family 2 protein [Microbacterium sp. 4R-513]|uniref:glycosyltransferase family 2 protein n=1 Tax=Microbacterium sp. 4R-513 TaxID=2567934 RepID=UPI0013E17327|nr:glycosyltransferase family 2 protein [Microbacterium sp. 4R-513]QIG38313.1 glycosyltransferase family 2 protein [Microbacterium sp. 4R-513]